MRASQSLVAVSSLLMAILGSSGPVQARYLTTGELKSLISGRMVYLNAPLGTIIPIRHDADGRLFGKAGVLATHLGSKLDRGRWWVRQGYLCHRWSRWFNGRQKCMRIKKFGDAFAWATTDGSSGTARLGKKLGRPRQLSKRYQFRRNSRLALNAGKSRPRGLIRGPMRVTRKSR